MQMVFEMKMIFEMGTMPCNLPHIVLDGSGSPK